MVMEVDGNGCLNLINKSSTSRHWASKVASVENLLGSKPMCFGSTNSWPEVANVSDFDRPFDSLRYMWEGSAGEAVWWGGERGVAHEIC